MSFDVVVAGGGPAGLCSALALRRFGLGVCVVDPTCDSEKPPVGEHLSARGLEHLDELGVGSLLAQVPSLPSPGMISVWATEQPQEVPAFVRPEGAGLHLARPAFERALGRALVEAGGVLRRSTKFLAAERDGHGFRALVRGPSGEGNLRARMLLDATGRSAALARRLGHRVVRRDRLIALVAQTECREQCLPLVESSPHGWWYSASLPCGRLQASYFTDADLRAPAGLGATWRLAIAGAPHTRARLGSNAAELQPRGICAHTQSLGGDLVPGVLAVGDAALALDPLSSAGLTEAIASGMRAAQTVDEALAGDDSALARYDATTQQFLSTHLAQRAHYYRLAERFGAEPFWQRRTLSAAPLAGTRVLPNTRLHMPQGATLLGTPLAALAPDIPPTALRDLTNEPRPARLIAADLRQRYRYHDAEIIHLLHALVAAGALQASGAPEHRAFGS